MRFPALKFPHASVMRILECMQIRITHAEHMAEAEFETESPARGHHVYQENWTPVIGEQLNCKREEENP